MHERDEQRGIPGHIRSDNGLEFVAKAECVERAAETPSSTFDMQSMARRSISRCDGALLTPTCHLASGPECVAKPALGAALFEKQRAGPLTDNSTFFFLQMMTASRVVFYQSRYL